MDKYIILENTTKTDYDYRVGDQIMMEINPPLNKKHHSKDCIKLFKRGQTGHLPYKRERLQLD